VEGTRLGQPNGANDGANNVRVMYVDGYAVFGTVQTVRTLRYMYVEKSHTA
jgi:hypothetical protein